MTSNRNASAADRPYTVLVLPDMHVPDHDAASLDAILQYTRDERFDELVQLGDFLDLDSVSAHNKNKPLLIEGARLSHDLEAGNEVLDLIELALHHNNKKGQITLLKGNHEWRLDRYLEGNPVLSGSLSVEEGLNLTSRGIRFVQCYPNGELYQIGDAHFFHGIFTTAYHARRHVDHYGVNIFYGHCFDEQTELLTKDGWKKGKDLDGSETVGTLSLADDVFEWNNINSVTRRSGFESVVAIDTPDVSLRVTDEHGMVLSKMRETGHYREFARISAKDMLHATSLIPTAANSHRHDRDLSFSPCNIDLMAWILQRGFYRKNNGISFNFSRAEFEQADEFQEQIVSAGVDWSVTATDAGRSYGITVPESHPIHSFFDWKIAPALSARFARLAGQWIDDLFETMAEIRGERLLKGYAVVTYNKETADWLQILGAMTGCSTRSSTNPAGAKTRYTVEIIHSADRWITSEDIRIAQNDRKAEMWCVSVDNATLFVRRNGKVCVTQNTHDVSSYSKSIHGKGTTLVGQSFGCLCNYAPPYMIGRPDNWQQAFGVFWFRPNGWFNYSVTRIFEGGFIAPNGKFYQGTAPAVRKPEPTYNRAQATHKIHTSPVNIQIVKSLRDIPISRSVKTGMDNTKKVNNPIEVDIEREFAKRFAPSNGLSKRKQGDVKRWIETETVSAPADFTPTGKMYGAYTKWCIDRHNKPVGIVPFCVELDTVALRERKGKHRGYTGIALRAEG